MALNSNKKFSLLVIKNYGNVDEYIASLALMNCVLQDIGIYLEYTWRNEEAEKTLFQISQ